MPPLFAGAPDCAIEDEATDAIESERRTIMGMPPLVPPRNDTVRMQPIERAAIVAPRSVTGSTPVAIIDEDVQRISLPWRPRVRAWAAYLWRRLLVRRRPVRRLPTGLSRPIVQRAPQGH